MFRNSKSRMPSS